VVASADATGLRSSDPTFRLMTQRLGGNDAGDVRDALAAADRDLERRFHAGETATELVPLRASLVDHLLRHLWTRHLGSDGDALALVAVGGFGRGELHPRSDIDLMILLPDTLDGGAEARLSAFVTSLWDLGVSIGHSVRTVDQCVETARDDITVATTLTEMRLLAGQRALFDEAVEATGPAHIWPSDRFFDEKRREQRTRHRRYDDTGYNLEPNVKGSPGGLRDIQMINWVAKRHFGTRDLAQLVDHGFLTRGQLRRLQKGQAFLWQVRFALHLLTGRSEDRLLFDHQRNLAQMLGYEDASYTLAVEQMMQRYYRTVMDLSRINEMLLQLFEEAILLDPRAEAVALNERFQIRNGYLQTADDGVFSREPGALLEVFLLLQQNPALRGVSAYTIGQIRRNLDLIDEEFRQNPRNHRLFMDILRAPEGVTHELRRMNLYGVLGMYIPAFGRIVGRMQYDLFHAYTVDEHILFVVSNMRKFALSRYNAEHPVCSRIVQSLDKPEVAYLSALFHDIGKGRGGDHSELGAVDAKAFCLEHGMTAEDAALVEWLVRHHLTLSSTAQKKDISDPDVINEFAALVGDQRHLDHLYVLTVADVRGTNPKLWNSWKASLFNELYEAASRVLRRDADDPIGFEELANESMRSARAELLSSGIEDEAIDRVWKLVDPSYFVRHRQSEIVWHTQWLAGAELDGTDGLVDIRRQRNGQGIKVGLYTPFEQHTFAHATAVIDELGMTIVDARIVPLSNGYSLDTFVFMEPDGTTDIDDMRMVKIQRALKEVVSAGDSCLLKVTRPLSRRQRMFTTPTDIVFLRTPQNDETILQIVAADRPGLLSTIGQVLMVSSIDISTAKIATIGERAEDSFYVCNEDGSPLSDAQQLTLKTRLKEAIDEITS